MWKALLSLYLFLLLEANAVLREYYIAAIDVDWNYAPAHFDKYNDKPLAESPAAEYTVQKKDRIGSTYRKAVYRKYTDSTFSTMVTPDASFGLLGPLIRAEMGDQVRIHFHNNASKPCNLHPSLPKDTTKIPDFEAIQPGKDHIYVWDVDTLDDQAMGNVSSTLWAYRSLTDPVQDMNAGLIGPLVVYKSGMLSGAPNAYPTGIDREIFTLMMTTEETRSKYFVESAKAAGISEERLKELAEDESFVESNRMYHINGFVFNNNPGIHLPYGSSVRWYVLAMGITTEDSHTAHWHGGTLLKHGHRVDVIDLMPSTFEVLDMAPDNAGQWLFHCHVASHLMNGMSIFYQVDEPEAGGSEG
ncbi:hypothetical protein NQZ79_g3831 [Umbelopsis isabellina]|nr:hypothetical protein NQZ79_g3831 [Umbelopsis isabellina]